MAPEKGRLGGTGAGRRPLGKASCNRGVMDSLSVQRSPQPLALVGGTDTVSSAAYFRNGESAKTGHSVHGFSHRIPLECGNASSRQWCPLKTEGSALFVRNKLPPATRGQLFASSARFFAQQGLAQLAQNGLAPSVPGFLAVQPIRQTALDSLPMLPQQPLHVQHARPRLVRVPRRVHHLPPLSPTATAATPSSSPATPASSAHRPPSARYSSPPLSGPGSLSCGAAEQLQAVGRCSVR